jgi:hypothetical protein
MCGMIKLCNVAGFLIIFSIIFFFLISPSNFGGAETKTVSLDKKSIEIQNMVDSLSEEIILLQNNVERKNLIIKDLLKFLKTERGKNYIKKNILLKEIRRKKNNV